MPRINSFFTTRVRNPGGASLLDYLARRFDYHPREEWTRLLDLGRLELDGRPARASDAPREGQRLRFAVVDYDEPDVPTDFRVLEAHGDSFGPLVDLALVHKPAGLPVHRTGKIFFQTLANLARERLGGPDDRAWAPLNRLDRETSGIVAFARGPEAFKALQPSNPATAWTKLYAAVIRAREGLPDALRLEAALGEKPGDVIRCRMHAFAPSRSGTAGLAGEPGGKAALTLGRVLVRRGDLALAVLSPITGRKHQLRAHLSAAGWPIVGDKIYSDGGRAYLARLEGDLDDAVWTTLGSRRHLLHAFHLRLETPAGGPGREAWDWDAGEEFEALFSLDPIRAWAKSQESEAFLAEIRAARETLGFRG